MALPTSGPLSMQDIATEFSQASSNMSLYTFGSTLPTPTVTSNIELAADFYGQSAVTLTSFSAVTNSNAGYEDGEAACEAAAEEPTLTTVYGTSVSGGVPAASSYVYTTNSTSNPLPANYYSIEGSGKNPNEVFEITGSSGQVNGSATECE